MIVLDTNVISDIFRPSPEPRVVKWLLSLTGDIAITPITLAELLAGVRRLPDGCRRLELASQRHVQHLDGAPRMAATGPRKPGRDRGRSVVSR